VHSSQSVRTEQCACAANHSPLSACRGGSVKGGKGCYRSHQTLAIRVFQKLFLKLGALLTISATQAYPHRILGNTAYNLPYRGTRGSFGLCGGLCGEGLAWPVSTASLTLLFLSHSSPKSSKRDFGAVVMTTHTNALTAQYVQSVHKPKTATYFFSRHLSTLVPIHLLPHANYPLCCAAASAQDSNYCYLFT